MLVCADALVEVMDVYVLVFTCVSDERGCKKGGASVGVGVGFFRAFSLAALHTGRTDKKLDGARG
jgi:hypothetical protein